MFALTPVLGNRSSPTWETFPISPRQTGWLSRDAWASRKWPRLSSAVSGREAARAVPPSGHSRMARRLPPMPRIWFPSDCRKPVERLRREGALGGGGRADRRKPVGRADAGMADGALVATDRLTTAIGDSTGGHQRRPSLPLPGSGAAPQASH